MKLVLAWMALVSAAPFATAGQVWVVGPAPAPYHDLQDTIILAQQGDVVLVRPGTYESIRMVGRSVTVVADNSLPVSLTGGMRVIDMAAGNTVVLSGLRSVAADIASLPESAAALYVRDCAGQVLAQDCSCSTPYAPWTSSSAGYPANYPPVWSLPDRGGLFASNCAGLAVVRTTFSTGSNSRTPGVAIQPGCSVSLDQVAALGSNGADGTNWYGDGDPGSPGLWVESPSTAPPSLVFAADGVFQGGTGGQGVYMGMFIYGYGGTGGHGITGQNANGPIFLLNPTAAGGAGGSGYGCNGSPGLPIYAPPFCPCWGGCSTGPATSHVLLPGTARTVVGPRLVRDSVSSVVLVCGGAPGERVELAANPGQLLFEYRPNEFGVLHVPKPAWRRVGIVPTSGTLGVTLPIPDLPLSNPGATFLIQARFVDPATHQSRLSNVHALVVVDATY